VLEVLVLLLQVNKPDFSLAPGFTHPAGTHNKQHTTHFISTHCATNMSPTRGRT
jgi:hypothetical protein